MAGWDYREAGVAPASTLGLLGDVIPAAMKEARTIISMIFGGMGMGGMGGMGGALGGGGGMGGLGGSGLNIGQALGQLGQTPTNMSIVDAYGPNRRY